MALRLVRLLVCNLMKGLGLDRRLVDAVDNDSLDHWRLAEAIHQNLNLEPVSHCNLLGNQLNFTFTLLSP